MTGFLVLVVACLMLGAPSALAGSDPSPDPVASAAASPDPAASPCPSPDAATPTASASSSPDAPFGPTPSDGTAATPDGCVPAASSLDLGRDGRLTLLLLGSDFRATVPGERMDVVLVMSLDPATGRVIAASLPRDLVFIPRARSNGGGTSGAVRINALYELYRRPELEHGRVDRRAMRRFVRDVETALGVEVDHWAMTRFKGFGALIESLGGVRVAIPERITDPIIGRAGAFFPADDDHPLRGLMRCDLTRPCRNVLTYVRSRRGTVGESFNSDFQRARRQQQVVMAAVHRVVASGLELDALARVVGVTGRRLWTDLPVTLDVALELVRLGHGARLRPSDSVVFGPRRWAVSTRQTPQYTFRLRLADVRAWMAERFAAEVEASPSPSASAPASPPPT